MQAARTLFGVASRSGNVEEINSLLAAGADPNATNSCIVPPIYAAIESSHEAAAMALLEVTDVRLLNNKHSIYGYSAIHIAIHKRWANFIKAAIAKGANLTTKNNEGQTDFDIIMASDRFTHDQKAEILAEAAWSRRSALVMLRRRFKQAWEAECDAREAAAAQAPPATPDA
jgi:ankyrin repeat protein